MLHTFNSGTSNRHSQLILVHHCPSRNTLYDKVILKWFGMAKLILESSCKLKNITIKNTWTVHKTLLKQSTVYKFDSVVISLKTMGPIVYK